MPQARHGLDVRRRLRLKRGRAPSGFFRAVDPEDCGFGEGGKRSRNSRSEGAHSPSSNSGRVASCALESESKMKMLSEAGMICDSLTRKGLIPRSRARILVQERRRPDHCFLQLPADRRIQSPQRWQGEKEWWMEWQFGKLKLWRSPSSKFLENPDQSSLLSPAIVSC